MLCAIWAEDKNGLIGSDSKLPWHLPNDLKYFKEKTLGNIIVMGRTTFEGMGKRLLPNRETVVLTHDINYQGNGATVLNSKQAVLDLMKTTNKDIFIVGGTSVYNEFLDHCDYLFKTKVNHKFNGDSYIPNIDYSKFNLIKTTPGIINERNLYSHCFFIYERK